MSIVIDARELRVQSMVTSAAPSSCWVACTASGSYAPNARFEIAIRQFAATSALTFSGAVPLESACSAVVTARQAITAMKNVWRILTCRPAPSQLLAGAWRDLELLGDRSGVANRRDVGLGVDHDLLQSRTICRRNLHAVRPRTARE